MDSSVIIIPYMSQKELMTDSKISKAEHVIRYWMLGQDMHLALSAMEFAKKYHTGVRKDGETPEFAHQLGVALLIRTLPRIDKLEEVIATAFLHDVVEDYNISIDEIRMKLGDEVAYAVKRLSKKIDGLKRTTTDYYQEIAECPIASIVKGSDRINNTASMQGVFDKDKQLSYIKETRDYIIPMLKSARRKFSVQEAAYENIKYTLNILNSTIEYFLTRS